MHIDPYIVFWTIAVIIGLGIFGVAYFRMWEKASDDANRMVALLFHQLDQDAPVSIRFEAQFAGLGRRPVRLHQGTSPHSDGTFLTDVETGVYVTVDIWLTSHQNAKPLLAAIDEAVEYLGTKLEEEAKKASLKLLSKP